jgi:hypothetical protein
MIKLILCSLAFCITSSAATAQATEKKTNTPDATKKIVSAEASCGKCKFGLPGKTCELAVRIDGNAWYVDGAGIDDFGDAHAKDGFCNAIRKADVQGELVNDKFRVSYFKLQPQTKKEE